MHGFAFLLLGLALGVDPIELPKDVHEINTRKFEIPLLFDKDARNTIQQVRMFVSVDRGKTWKHLKDCPSSDDRMVFSSITDGQYWFALQINFKDGTSEPAKIDDLAPGMKVLVNTERKALKVSEPKEELARLKAELASLSRENRMLKEELARLKGQPLEPKKEIQLALFAPTLGEGDDFGKITFQWQASGPNLPERSVSLFYKPTADAPWKQISANLPRKGSYTWLKGLDVPDRVFLRCQARDSDGKEVVVDTNKEVLLRPEAKTKP